MWCQFYPPLLVAINEQQKGRHSRPPQAAVVGQHEAQVHQISQSHHSGHSEHAAGIGDAIFQDPLRGQSVHRVHVSVSGGGPEVCVLFVCCCLHKSL